MPVWIAIRASCGLPLLLYPICYYEIDDLLIDGGIINNNPVGTYLEKLYIDKKKEILLINFKKFLSFKTTSLLNKSTNKIIKFYRKYKKNNNTKNNTIISKKKKYNRNFISIEYVNIEKCKPKELSLVSFLTQLMSFIFYNQESNRKEYKNFVYNINFCNCKYNLSPYIYEFTEENYTEIIRYTYNEFKKYFELNILNTDD